MDLTDPSLNQLVGADIAFMCTSAALVMLMTPGLAFFYAGMVRHKNVVSTILQCFITLGIITCMWTFVGFSLSFGANTSSSDKGGVIGNPATYGLFRHIGAAPHDVLGTTIPFALYWVFQLMFAVITPSLIVESFTERVQFSALCLFIVLFHLIVYCPLAFSVWAPGGLLGSHGILDFAGGTVVHMSSGYAALVGALYTGPGSSVLNTAEEPKEPASVPFVVFGTALLWFGWYGFNAGSALSASPLAVQAMITTTVAPAASLVAWLLLDKVRGRKMKATSICCGAVVGLVAITPGSGFVTAGGAMCIGCIGAAVCHLAQAYMDHHRKKVDDTLDVFACHGVGGTVGMVCTALFATTAANPAGQDGLFFGGVTLFWKTLVALVCIVPFICLASCLCYFITDCLVSLRVTSDDESRGLDITVHGERAAPMAELEQQMVKKLLEGRLSGPGTPLPEAMAGGDAAKGAHGRRMSLQLLTASPRIVPVLVQQDGLPSSGDE